MPLSFIIIFGFLGLAIYSTYASMEPLATKNSTCFSTTLNSISLRRANVVGVSIKLSGERREYLEAMDDRFSLTNVGLFADLN